LSSQSSQISIKKDIERGNPFQVVADETPHQTGMTSVLDTQDQVLALVPVLALSAEEEEGVEVEALVIKNIFYFSNMQK